jgi:hypothetical protein
MAYGKGKNASQCTGQEALASAYREKKSDIGTISDPSKSGGSTSSKGSIAPLPKIGK